MVGLLSVWTDRWKWKLSEYISVKWKTTNLSGSIGFFAKWRREGTRKGSKSCVGALQYQKDFQYPKLIRFPPNCLCMMSLVREGMLASTVTMTTLWLFFFKFSMCNYLFWGTDRHTHAHPYTLRHTGRCEFILSTLWIPAIKLRLSSWRQAHLPSFAISAASELIFTL